MVSYRNGLTFRLMEKCLNPYCSGQWSRTASKSIAATVTDGLNPYCSGQWSRTYHMCFKVLGPVVLILIVVDNGLVQAE